MMINRRLRGFLGTSLAWAAAFGGLGVALALLSLLALKRGIPVPWRWLGGTVLALSAIGLCSGAIFSGLLLLLERGRRLSALSAGRLSTWGVIAGVLVPLYPCVVLLGHSLMPGGWFGAAVVCAVGGSLGLATAQVILRAGRRASEPMLSRGSSPVSPSV